MYFTLEEKENPESFLRLYLTRVSYSETMPCLFCQSFHKCKSMHSLKTYIWSQLTFSQSQKASAALLIAEAFYYVLMSDKIFCILLAGSILKKNCEDKLLNYHLQY